MIHISCVMIYIRDIFKSSRMKHTNRLIYLATRDEFKGNEWNRRHWLKVK